MYLKIDRRPMRRKLRKLNFSHLGPGLQAVTYIKYDTVCTYKNVNSGCLMPKVSFGSHEER